MYYSVLFYFLLLSLMARLLPTAGEKFKILCLKWWYGSNLAMGFLMKRNSLDEF